MRETRPRITGYQRVTVSPSTPNSGFERMEIVNQAVYGLNGPAGAARRHRAPSRWRSAPGRQSPAARLPLAIRGRDPGERTEAKRRGRTVPGRAGDNAVADGPGDGAMSGLVCAVWNLTRLGQRNTRPLA